MDGWMDIRIESQKTDCNGKDFTELGGYRFNGGGGQSALSS
jgi:hypothetical protein